MEATITLEFHVNSHVQGALNNGQQAIIVPTREDDFARYGYPVYGGEVFKESGEHHYPKDCWFVIGDKTIAEIRKDTGISRYTIHSAVTSGMLQAVSRQSGKTWIVNTDTEEYKAWLSRPEQPRGKGKPRGTGQAK